MKDTEAHRKDKRSPRQNAILLAPFVLGRSLAQAPEAARAAIAGWGDLSPGTVNRRLAVIKAACTHAWRQGWAAQNYSGRIPRLREPPGREVYLTRAEVNRLAKAADEPLRTVILLAAYTGMRAGEFARAVPSADRKTIALPDSKNGKPRVIPVAERVRPLVRALPITVPYARLEWAFRDARERAGLPHVRLHDLRHTAASWLINSGADLYTVGKILGHRSVTTTARYAHLSQQTLAKAVARLR